MNKLQCVPTVEYYTAIRKSKLLINAARTTTQKQTAVGKQRFAKEHTVHSTSG